MAIARDNRGHLFQLRLGDIVSDIEPSRFYNFFCRENLVNEEKKAPVLAAYRG
jgi:hypothetical protein